MCEHRRVTGNIDIGALALGRWGAGAGAQCHSPVSRTQGIPRHKALSAYEVSAKRARRRILATARTEHVNSDCCASSTRQLSVLRFRRHNTVVSKGTSAASASASQGSCGVERHRVGM